MFTKSLALLISLTFATSVYAADLGAATFSNMHIRPASGELGVGFFTVVTSSNDTIIKIRSDASKATELHRNEKNNGVMSMRRISSQDLKKGTPLNVQPDVAGGEHLMLIGLEKPLAEGDKVSVTFTFKKGGEQTVIFPVYADKKDASEHDHH